MVNSHGGGESKRSRKKEGLGRVVTDGRVSLDMGEYTTVSLGVLAPGCVIRIMVEELQRREFMFFVVDDEGLRGCKHELFFTAFLEGSRRSRYDESGTLEKGGRHHLVLSCPSQKEGNEICYRVEIQG